MINFIKGNIVSIEDEYIVIENNGLGYKVFTSQVTMTDFINLNVKENILINTEMVVREDDISLFGFSSDDELLVFNLLRTVSRVGAKSALKMLSTMHYSEIIRIIKNNDHKSLTKAKGVGAKTAKRIIIDLNEKMINAFPDERTALEKQHDAPHPMNTDALEAMMALGYSKSESESALSAFDHKDKTVEEIIKLALNYF